MRQQADYIQPQTEPTQPSPHTPHAAHQPTLRQTQQQDRGTKGGGEGRWVQLTSTSEDLTRSREATSWENLVVLKEVELMPCPDRVTPVWQKK